MNRKKGLWRTVRIAISITLIAILLYRISPGKLARNLESLNPYWIIAAFAVFLLSSILGALQWHVLLGAGGVFIPFGRTFRLYFTGLFFNNLLPTNVGGDAFKIYDVVKVGYDPHKVFAITLLDRIFGITGLCFLALIAAFLLLPLGTTKNLPLYILIFAGCILPIILIAFNRKISSPVRRFFSDIKLWGLGERFELVFSYLGSFRSLKRLLGNVILLTVTIQFLRIVTHILVGKALGLRMGGVEYLQFYVFVPLLGLVMMLPISINGLGIREGAGILLFTQMGFLEEQAFLMEFITYVVMVIVSLLGGLIFLRKQISSVVSGYQRGDGSMDMKTKRKER